MVSCISGYSYLTHLLLHLSWLGSFAFEGFVQATILLYRITFSTKVLHLSFVLTVLSLQKNTHTRHQSNTRISSCGSYGWGWKAALREESLRTFYATITHRWSLNGDFSISSLSTTMSRNMTILFATQQEQNNLPPMESILVGRPSVTP